MAIVKLPSRIRVVEVGPRDGFQMEQAFIPTDLKISVIDAVSRSGIGKIETTSFVSPKAVPQMADAAEVMARIERVPGVAYTALIPNEKGAELALASRVDAMRLVVCASETYNQRNVRMSVAESVSACEAILDVARRAGIPVEVAISVAFGCPFEGPIPESRVVELATTFQTMGVREIAIADTVGLANPRQVERLIGELRQTLDPDVALSLHFHDTRGLGLANVLAGMQEGVDTFDAAIGGLGGCPVIATATGNISTEDLVNLCEEMGVETGVDLEPIMEASRSMERFLERKLPSHVLLSGTPRQVYESRH
jgi:hydroxymethylglutaryl-CoA lyase